MKLKTLAPLALLLLSVGSAVAQSQDRVLIRDNEVVEIKFESAISAKSNHRGDRITATVDNDRILPSGTRLIGEILEIRSKDGDRKAYADMEFTSLELPDGKRVSIEAYPLPLGDRFVRRGRDGRLEAKKATRRENVVLGSGVGGLLLGTIFRKPFEGAVIGVLAGIVISETDALNTSGEQIVQKGQKMGAAFSREVDIDLDYRYDRENRDRDRDNRDDSRDRDDRYESDRDIRIEFRDRVLDFRSGQTPFPENGIVMVPLEAVAEQLGLDVSRTNSNAWYLEDQENTLKLEQNSSDARLNGKRISLPRATVERNGLLFVPIQTFAAIKRDPIFVNGARVEYRSTNEN
ncbi:MAG TPA: copper amine oxidase N-terminal domain-containing protein [Fimbriimonadaceae bacterium]|nr:copper amine oxidase N-terminal domain-containing protein [Fimbriimonadaceae bacterium]